MSASISVVGGVSTMSWKSKARSDRAKPSNGGAHVVGLAQRDEELRAAPPAMKYSAHSR